MTPILAKVTAIEKRGDQYQVIVQISPRYRGSFNTLAFGEIKPHSGSLKDGRLDLVYYQNPGLNIGDPITAANKKYADYLELELANNWVRTRCFQLCMVVTIEF